MSNKTIADRHSVPNGNEETSSMIFRDDFINRPLSRRTVVASLLGTAGAAAAWQSVGASPQAQATCQPGPESASALQQSQLDYTNQGLVVKPAKGIVATFGNSFYRLDAATNT